MTVVRSTAFAVLLAAAASLAPLPGTTAVAESRCSAYQPGERTPERRQLMESLIAAINQSNWRGQKLRVKKLWLACDYARVVMTPRGRGQGLDALMVKVNGEWRFGMFADPSVGSPAAQYRAAHADIPEVLVYW